jgi:TolB-like protein
MKLHNLFAAVAGLALAGTTALAQGKPTVAVLYFNNSALGKSNEELAPLTKGIADLMIQELAANTGIRVVERDAMQKILEEQKLSQDGKVDPQTAVKVGKLLGAHHMVTGVFLTDPKATTMKISLRVFNVETSEIEYTTDASDKPDNVLTLVSKLAAKTNKGLKLPDLPVRVSEAREKAAEKVPFQTVMLYSRAINAKDAGKKDEAISLFKQSLEKFPSYEPSQKELAKLQGKS